MTCHVALDLTGKVRYGAAGYTFRGDAEGANLDDAFFASLGGTYAATDTVRWGAFYDFREASFPGNDDMHEASIFASTRILGDWRMHGYLFAGFTDSSPEWGTGMTVTRRF